jgi:hypothetical protein
LNVFMTAPLSDSREVLSQLKSLVFEKIVTEDRSGRTPFIVLAQMLAQLPPDDEIKKKYAWASVRIINKVQQMSAKQLGMLLRFLHKSGIPSKDIVEKVRDFLKSQSPLTSETGKRAEIIRWLIDTGLKMLPQELELEEAVKAQFPWLWIEAMMQTDWNSASDAIVENLKQQQSATELLAFLPYLWSKNRIIAEDFSRWCEVLPAREVDKLKEWFTKRCLSFPASISSQKTQAIGAVEEVKNWTPVPNAIARPGPTRVDQSDRKFLGKTAFAWIVQIQGPTTH